MNKTPARLRPGRIFLYAAVFFVLMMIGSIAWKLATMAAPGETRYQPAAANTTVADAPNESAVSTGPKIPAAPTDTSARSSVPLAADLAPASLRDSEVDGGITIRDGRIVPDLELRRLFDYFLSALGEKPLADIRTWLMAHVRERYGADTIAETIDLFDRYVALLQATERLSLTGLDQRARHTQLSSLRRNLLGPELADAFFGAEERYLTYTLDRLDVLKDATLSPAVRAQKLDELARGLPEGELSLQQDSTIGALVDEQTQQLDAIGASAEDRFNEREALVGKEAAGRLATLDAERLAWDERIARYKATRALILADEHLDARTRELRLTQLLTTEFDEAERRRVQSLDAIGRL